MPQQEIQRIIVSIDGSIGDMRILQLVGQLGEKKPVEAILLYVVEVAQAMPLDAEMPREIDRGEDALRRAEEYATTTFNSQRVRVQTELLQARSAGSAIVDEAINRRAQAIALAAVNYHQHGKTTMGDTISYVLKNAPCDVMLVRQAP